MEDPWYEWLADAPIRLQEWAWEQPDARAAWSQCTNAAWMLEALELSGADRRTLVLCACECARTVLHRVKRSRPAARDAIEAAEGWAVGEITAAERHRLAKAANEAARSDRAALAAAHAAFASASSSSTAARHAAYVHGAPNSLADRVRDQRWPPTSPDLAIWPIHAQVAWDWVCEQTGPPGALSTVDALIAPSVLGRLGGDWRLRPLAERLVGAPELIARTREVLAGG